MARIDVSDILLDPDFTSSFIIVNRVPTINSYGENTIVETEINTIGSVQAAGKETAKRLPDGVQLSNFITLFTKTEIIADASGKYVDQIKWKGRTYNVFQVLPWDNFGGGWYMVDCELQRVTL